MKNNNYREYKYVGITKTLEDDVIGYDLFKSGYVKEDLTEIDAENIYCSLNKEPLKDIAKLRYKEGEFFISKIHYSKTGNYLGDEDEFFTLP